MRIMPRETSQSHHLYEAVGNLVRQAAAFSLQLKAKHGVVFYRPPGKEAVGLEDKSSIRTRSHHLAAIQENFSRSRFEKTIDDAQERRLPASTSSYDADKLRRLNPKIDIPENLDLFSFSLAEYFGEFPPFPKSA